MAHETAREPERAILVSLADGGARGRLSAEGETTPHDREELALLATTAGSEVVGRIEQRRGSLHPATFLSRGKVDDARRLAESEGASLAIFDEDLSPAQVRNLEKALDLKIIDRTELILDIFATRARSHEAQVQVELAQLQYLLPRLTRMWVHLSRQEGGIGMRGPGETQLEVDRRRVRQRISMLKQRLLAVERERRVQRQRRKNMFRASLVGYTNAGKSTLFNALTRAGVLEEDQLFATLETTTRRLGLENGKMVLLSDTVGFIRKLPHHLVASFRATLGEVRESDLLIHVVDASSESFRQQMGAVDEVIDGLLDGRTIACLLVLNKADRLSEERAMALRAEFPDAAILCARDRQQALGIKEHLAEAMKTSRPGDASVKKPTAGGMDAALEAG